MSRPSHRRGTQVAALAFAGLLLALLAYWWGSPYLAVREMGEAAQAGDGERFSAHVDYPRLRESLKAQFAARLQRSADDTPGDHPLAGLGRVMGLAMIEPVVDTLVRPEVVMLAVRQGVVVGAAGAGSSRPNDARIQPGEGEPRWRYEREGANRVIVVPHAAQSTGGASPRPLALVFERRGFARWNLVELRLPPAG